MKGFLIAPILLSLVPSINAAETCKFISEYYPEVTIEIENDKKKFGGFGIIKYKDNPMLDFATGLSNGYGGQYYVIRKLSKDIAYEDEVTHPHGRDFGPYEVSPDESLLTYYKDLIKLRNDEPALRTGDYTTMLVDDEQGYFAFTRESGSDSFLALFNLGSSNWTPDSDAFGETDQSEWTLIMDSNSETDASIGPRAGKVYKRIK